MQRFNNQTTQNRLTRWALRPLLAIVGLCFSQFAAAQSSDIDASVSFNVPISLSCTSNLTFGNISIISTGDGTSDGSNSLYNSNRKLKLNPVTGNTEGALITNNLNVSGHAFGSCEITGVARGSTLNLSLSPSFNSTFGQLDSETTTHSLTFRPLMVDIGGNTADGSSTNTIEISTSDDTNYGLNSSAINDGAYSYDDATNTFTFRIGGELSFNGLAGVTPAQLAGAYTDSVSILVEL